MLAPLNPFDFDAIRSRMEAFALRAPELLAKHTLTADLSMGLQGLLDQADRPFTVAVVGQMRVGKSTLLNALVGQDLAITGVNETTATLNWLKYGDGDLVDRFRVVWKDRPEELLPREQLPEWIGDSDKAKAASFLEFFANSPVLKEANFVDTPGMRSVIESHEDTITEFLSTKWDKESQSQGGKADAIVYVFPGTARVTDQSCLEDFAEARIPGSSPINSIGVIHKWDALNEDRPFDVIHAKAKKLESVMGKLVSEIIPVSAPLYIAADRYGSDFWETLSEFVKLDDEDFEDLLMDEAEFREFPIDGLRITPEQRAQFRLDYPLPWSSLCLILKHAASHGLIEPDAIKAEILERSGVPYLQRQLQRRFFSRSRLIKVMSIISRAWEPCAQALIRLRNAKMTTQSDKDHLPDLVTAVRSAPTINTEHAELMEQAATFIEGRAAELEEALVRASSLLSCLDRELGDVKGIHDDLDHDWQCVEQVEGNLSSLVPETLHAQLLSVFGYNGPSLAERISPWSVIEDDSAQIEAIEGFLNEVLQLQQHRRLSSVIEQAERRLEQILDILEQKVSGTNG
ncbi:MAG: dynamin family protein [Opitutaceae bacterium]